MIVGKSRLVLEAGEARIVATVRSEAGHFTPFDLVIGVPDAYVGWLDLSGNPFVPTLLLLAGVLGESLRLESSVSPLLLNNTRKACELFRSWWGIAPVPIEAQAVAAETHPGDGTALFFTRGVDSWYSALRGTANQLPERLSHLLYAPDLDRQYTPPLRRRALGLTREAAACIDLAVDPDFTQRPRPSRSVRQLGAFPRWRAGGHRSRPGRLGRQRIRRVDPMT